MTLEEYFGRWMRVIDKRELESVLSNLDQNIRENLFVLHKVMCLRHLRFALMISSRL